MHADRLLSLGEPLDTYEHSDLYQALAKVIEGADSVIFVAEAADQLIGLAEVYVEIWEFEEGPLRFYEKNDYRTLRRTLVRAL